MIYHVTNIYSSVLIFTLLQNINTISNQIYEDDVRGFFLSNALEKKSLLSSLSNKWKCNSCLDSNVLQLKDLQSELHEVQLLSGGQYRQNVRKFILRIEMTRIENDLVAQRCINIETIAPKSAKYLHLNAGTCKNVVTEVVNQLNLSGLSIFNLFQYYIVINGWYLILTLKFVSSFIEISVLYYFIVALLLAVLYRMMHFTHQWNHLTESTVTSYDETNVTLEVTSSDTIIRPDLIQSGKILLNEEPSITLAQTPSMRPNPNQSSYFLWDIYNSPTRPSTSFTQDEDGIIKYENPLLSPPPPTKLKSTPNNNYQTYEISEDFDECGQFIERYMKKKPITILDDTESDDGKILQISELFVQKRRNSIAKSINHLKSNSNDDQESVVLDMSGLYSHVEDAASPHNSYNSPAKYFINEYFVDDNPLSTGDRAYSKKSILQFPAAASKSILFPSFLQELVDKNGNLSTNHDEEQQLDPSKKSYLLQTTPPKSHRMITNCDSFYTSPHFMMEKTSEEKKPVIHVNNDEAFGLPSCPLSLPKSHEKLLSPSLSSSNMKKYQLRSRKRCLLTPFEDDTSFSLLYPSSSSDEEDETRLEPDNETIKCTRHPSGRLTTSEEETEDSCYESNFHQKLKLFIDKESNVEMISSIKECLNLIQEINQLNKEDGDDKTVQSESTSETFSLFSTKFLLKLDILSDRESFLHDCHWIHHHILEGSSSTTPPVSSNRMEIMNELKNIIHRLRNQRQLEWKKSIMNRNHQSPLPVNPLANSRDSQYSLKKKKYSPNILTKFEVIQNCETFQNKIESTNKKKSFPIMRSPVAEGNGQGKIMDNPLSCKRKSIRSKLKLKVENSLNLSKEKDNDENIGNQSITDDENKSFDQFIRVESVYETTTKTNKSLKYDSNSDNEISCIPAGSVKRIAAVFSNQFKQ